MWGQNWKKISSGLKGHDEMDCRTRWLLLKGNDSSVVGRWSEQETAKLKSAYKKYGKNYAAITREFPGRTRQ